MAAQTGFCFLGDFSLPFSFLAGGRELRPASQAFVPHKQTGSCLISSVLTLPEPSLLCGRHQEDAARSTGSSLWSSRDPPGWAWKGTCSCCSRAGAPPGQAGPEAGIIRAPERAGSVGRAGHGEEFPHGLLCAVYVQGDPEKQGRCGRKGSWKRAGITAQGRLGDGEPRSAPSSDPGFLGWQRG